MERVLKFLCGLDRIPRFRRNRAQFCLQDIRHVLTVCANIRHILHWQWGSPRRCIGTFAPILCPQRQVDKPARCAGVRPGSPIWLKPGRVPLRGLSLAIMV